MNTRILRLALVSSLGLAALSTAACNKSEASGGASTAAPGADGKVTVIANQDGFKPSEIRVQKGKPATLVFKRTSDDTCATEVDFPELKIKKPLPLNQEVSIEIPAGEARTYGFQCGMGMYKSKVIVQ
jgi:plastocyanin domain-containing protein